jgi:DNA-binding NarL/FixJ family response regulator
MRYLIEGRMAKEIAHLLQVSPKTIESHKRNAFVKLGALNGCHACSKYTRKLLTGE